jgi:prevent-host-death family protein
MKWMNFAEVRAKLAQAIEVSQDQDVVILVRGKPAAKIIGIEGQTIDALVGEEQEIVRMLHERQQNPGKSIPLEQIEVKIAKRLQAEGAGARARRPRAAATTRRPRGAR